MPGTSSPAPPKGLPEWRISTEQDDNLSPWALAQAWALIRCSDKFGLHLSDAQIAGQVTKGNGDHPRKQRIQQLRAIFASDPAWYPGKVKPDAQKRGPKPVMTVAKKRAIASADMGLGRAGLEPPVANVVEQAPRATLNPKTKMPFTEKYIVQAFRSYCFDEGSNVPWDHQAPLQNTAPHVSKSLAGKARVAKESTHLRLQARHLRSEQKHPPDQKKQFPIDNREHRVAGRRLRGGPRTGSEEASSKSLILFRTSQPAPAGTGWHQPAGTAQPAPDGASRPARHPASPCYTEPGSQPAGRARRQPASPASRRARQTPYRRVRSAGRPPGAAETGHVQSISKP